MRSSRLLALVLPAAFLGGLPAYAHDSCTASVTHVYTSASGVYGKANGGCGSQHQTTTLSVCVQYLRSDGTWKCVDGSYRKTVAHNNGGPWEVLSGTVCNSTTRTYRIRGHLQAYNESGQKVHDPGLKFSGATTFRCPGAATGDAPDLPVELDDILP